MLWCHRGYVVFVTPLYPVWHILDIKEKISTGPVGLLDLCQGGLLGAGQQVRALEQGPPRRTGDNGLTCSLGLAGDERTKYLRRAGGVSVAAGTLGVLIYVGLIVLTVVAILSKP